MSSTDQPGDDQGVQKKKEEKRLKKKEKSGAAASVLFMVKSDTDLLEDGCRWKKYGQLVPKNNIYPRSYYRCATQKHCTMKKRIERSTYQPSTVMITYEGQHNHNVPPTLDGKAGGCEMRGNGGSSLPRGFSSPIPNGFCNFCGGGMLYPPSTLAPQTVDGGCSFPQEVCAQIPNLDGGGMIYPPSTIIAHDPMMTAASRPSFLHEFSPQL